MEKNDRINKLLLEVTSLEEYQLPHKNDLVGIINKMVLTAKSSSNPQEVDKKLNNILEFYRYYTVGVPQEDTIVYQEFKNKLLNLAKNYNIKLN